MLEYTPEGLNTQGSITKVRLAWADDDRRGFYLQLAIVPTEGGSLTAEVRTGIFTLSRFGLGFQFMTGPEWMSQASEIERRNPDGHRDYVLSQALEQGRITLSCSVGSVDEDEYLFFRARLGLGGDHLVEGRIPFQLVARFISRTAELTPAK